MFVYLVAIGISGCFGLAASHATDRYVRIGLGLLAILPYCLVAGLRSADVGTDTSGYPYQLYKIAMVGNLGTYLSSVTASNVEVLFRYLTFALTKLFGSFHFNLFVYQILVTAPLLYCLFQLCPLHIGLGLVAYGLLYFPFTLNVVRQSISAAFLLVCFVCALRVKYKWFVLFIAISTGFHNTGLLGVVIVPVVEALRQIEISSNKVTRRRSAEVFVLCVCAASCVFALLIIYGDRWIGLLEEIKASYWVQAAVLGEQKFIISIIGLCVVYTALYALTFRSSRTARASLQLNAALTLFLMGGILCQMAVIGTHMNRVGRGLFLFVALYVPLLMQETIRKNRMLSYIVLLGLAAIYFLYVYVYTNEGVVLPYSSDIIPLLGLF